MPATTPSLAARLGRWSAQHRRAALVAWLAFVVLAFAGGMATGTRQPTGSDSAGEAGRGEEILDGAFPDDADEAIIVQAPRGGRVTDPGPAAAAREVLRAVRAVPIARDVEAGEVSRDGRARRIAFALSGGPERTEPAVEPVLAAVARAGRAHPGVYVGQFGEASAARALDDAVSGDFRRAEVLSLPITLLILLVAFGAVVAAGIPLLLALTSVAATLGLVSLLSQAIPVDDTVSSVVLLVGLAVGVDYTLFYLRREREERRRGASERDALATAAATSGRAVLVSGATVMIAMAGLLLGGDRTFTSLGIGAILVVGVAMLGSVTVVPAVLAGLGDRVERGRIPGLGRSRARRRRSRAWPAILRLVLGRPAVSAALAVAALLVMAWPATHMRTSLPGMDDLPQDLPVMRAYDALQAAFPGGEVPGVIALRAGDVTAPAVRARIAVLRERVAAAPHLSGPVDVSVSRDHRVASIAVPMAGDGTDGASLAGLRELRGDVVPAAFGGLAGVEAAVTGQAAGTKDFNDLVGSRLPLIFGFVLGFAFLLMLVTFRSLVIPVKAIAMNLLSVGAAYGVLTWVFQDGHLEGPLAFQSPGAVVSWLPVFLFVILFGLSMDYHVFILSRVREAWARGLPTERAVAEGLTATAGTVTSAAVVMVAVFAIFATLSSIEFKMMGVGLATAIAIDATLVRAVLLPAAMKLLGDWNWYLPRWLEWLPRLERGPEPVRPAPAPVPAVVR